MKDLSCESLAALYFRLCAALVGENAMPSSRLQIETYSTIAQQSKHCHHGTETAASTMPEITSTGHYVAAHTNLLRSQRDDVRKNYMFAFVSLDLT